MAFSVSDEKEYIERTALILNVFKVNTERHFEIWTPNPLHHKLYMRLHMHWDEQVMDTSDSEEQR
jgi:hypothetical protein